MAKKGEDARKQVVDRIAGFARKAEEVERFLRRPDSPFGEETTLEDACFTLAFLTGRVAGMAGVDTKAVFGAVSLAAEFTNSVKTKAASDLGAALATGDPDEIAKAAAAYARAAVGVDAQVTVLGVEPPDPAKAEAAGKGVDEAMAKIIGGIEKES